MFVYRYVYKYILYSLDYNDIVQVATNDEIKWQTHPPERETINGKMNYFCLTLPFLTLTIYDSSATFSGKIKPKFHIWGEFKFFSKVCVFFNFRIKNDSERYEKFI